MSGTKIGGLKAAQTNKQRYGDSFYREVGRKGGQASKGGGFAANPELAREAGRKGGLKSRGGGRKKMVIAKDVKVEGNKVVKSKGWFARLF